MENIHAKIVKRILAVLETGVIPWVKPWDSAFPYNAISKRNYTGVNALLLMNHPEGPAFVTARQGEENGGTLKPGARYELICRYGTYVRKDEKKASYFLKYYRVFPVLAFDGLEHLQYVPKRADTEHTPVQEAEDLIAALAPDIRIGATGASYSPIKDAINMPHPETFMDTAHWYSTLFHEVAHWTGHKTRCDRDLSNPFGSPKYAQEELIAEIASAILCATVGIEKSDLRVNDEVMENTAAYCASWSARLKVAPATAVTQASSKAFKAVEYVTSTVEKTCPVE